jgi:hypothetical protein
MDEDKAKAEKVAAAKKKVALPSPALLSLSQPFQHAMC